VNHAHGSLMLSHTPLWSATARPITLPTAPPPAAADVAVIGGGYTGLAAARALARAGASVVVLERERIGAGASGRNGGFVLPGYKADPASVLRRFGRARARVLFEASLTALAFVERVVDDEGIACDWGRPGGISLAARPAHLAVLRSEQQLLAREFGHPTVLLGPADLPDEIGSSRYHGGLLDETAGAVQPVDYLLGLAVAAARAGTVLSERAGVRRLRRAGRRFRVETEAGEVDAGEVLVATNGYGGRLIPWLARRIVPVGSFIIATAPLPPALAARLIPRRRVLSDTKNLLYYFRLSADRRLVFGGRAAFRPEAVDRSLAILRAGMLEVFPETREIELEFGWGGTLGFTLDQLPHAGRRDGVSYAMGYCGHGVACASWLGDQVGSALAGRGPWPSLAEPPFPAVPLYGGRPWFLSLAGAYYRAKDWLT
jgi:glycine/D-amino acid oxidase-like deaminating enzyme